MYVVESDKIRLCAVITYVAYDLFGEDGPTGILVISDRVSCLSLDAC